MLIALTGMITGLSLIIAIGAQNAFILRLGLKREHVLLAVLFCSLADALLIFAGIAGLGRIIEQAPILLEILRYAGAAYLAWFGFSAIRRAMHPEILLAGKTTTSSTWKTIGSLAAITFLNPHVYLDTVILLGSIGNQFAPSQWIFGLGAAAGSFAWFFGLGFGARLLSKYVQKPMFWRVLDSFIAIVMLTIALYLLFGL
jgi:L-lysine exporter family protein LysE/ArgO